MLDVQYLILELIRRIGTTVAPNRKNYPPISTVGAPGGMIAPPPAVRSPTRAAGRPPIRTVAEPFAMTSGPQVSDMRAAGNPAINTVGAPGGRIGVGTPEVAVLTIKSVIRAAGNNFKQTVVLFN